MFAYVCILFIITKIKEKKTKNSHLDRVYVGTKFKLQKN